MPTVTPSETIVIEVTCQFVQSGLLAIPDTGRINVKAVRAFLSIAQRLQEHILFVWATNRDLNLEDVHKIKHEQRVLVIIGAGGTGKTYVLQMAEALCDFFSGTESVRKCVISNAVARLLEGDTLHALCTLPMIDL